MRDDTSTIAVIFVMVIIGLAIWGYSMFKAVECTFSGGVAVQGWFQVACIKP
jgi:hypothetical protein